jgi:hypothetical protein
LLNLITRTIVPYIYQEDRIGNGSQSGLGDTTFSAFFTPKEPTHGGLIWGIGPDIYFPTATRSALGAVLDLVNSICQVSRLFSQARAKAQRTEGDAERFAPLMLEKLTL